MQDKVLKTKTIIKGKKPYNGRVYRYADGVYLSVTSVINPEGIVYPPELLKQYSSRGTIVHKMAEYFFKHYRVPTPQEVATPEDLSNVLSGSLALKIEDCNFVGFFQEYGEHIKIAHIEKEVRNTTYKYAGRADIIGLYDDTLAIMDMKTSGNYTPAKLTNYWKQQAAYAHCMTPVPQTMVLLPFNPTAPNGYEPPLIETDVEGYFKLFLEDLENVKANYIMPQG